MGLAVDLDPRPGGIYRVTPNEREVIRGEFVEIVPNRKVSFTWGWERGGPDVPAGSTRVDIELIPENGGTRVRLVHNHLPNAVREQHAFGWNHHFGRLKVAAEGGDPGPDPCWSDVQQFPPRQTQEVLK